PDRQVGSPTVDNSEYGTTGRSAAGQVHVGSSTSSDIAKNISVKPIRIAGMRRWSGVITDVEDGIFTAELTPLGHHRPVVLADFEVSDLDADDPDSISPGDLFYLNVRTVRDRRRLARTSTLLLRRLGDWSPRELKESEDEARKNFDAISDYVQ